MIAVSSADRTGPPARHRCLVHRGNESFVPSLTAAFREKLAAGHRCLFLAGPDFGAELTRSLDAEGVSVAELERRGALVVSSSTDYLVGGRFLPDRMIAKWEDLAERALRDGYEGLFAAGDASWEFGAQDNLARLAEYESKVEALFRLQPALSAVCVYRAEALPAQAIADALYTHESLFAAPDGVRANPYFFQGYDWSRRTALDPRTIDWMLRDALDDPSA